MNVVRKWKFTQKRLAGSAGSKDEGFLLEFQRDEEKYPAVTLYVRPILDRNLVGDLFVRSLEVQVHHGHPDEARYLEVRVQA